MGTFWALVIFFGGSTTRIDGYTLEQCHAAVEYVDKIEDTSSVHFTMLCVPLPPPVAGRE